jgi:glutathione synthase/RimK-type ligase-like ATP-grasp enzyme
MKVLVTNVHAQQAYATIRALRPHAERLLVASYPTGGLLGRLPHGAFTRLADKRCPVPSPVADWQAGNIQPDNTEREEAYVKAMLGICAAEGVDVIYPSWDPDVYVLSKNRQRFADRGVLIPVPEFEVAIRALDKYRTIEAAQAAGFPCPRTYLYENAEEARGIAAREGFPLVVKPRFTSGGRGLAIVHDIGSLLERLAAEPAGHVKPIIQEYIPGGHKESLQFVFDRAGNPAFLFHKKRLRTFRVTARFCTVSRSAELPPWHRQVSALMRSLGWWGAGGIEVLIDPRDGGHRLMEVNARYPRQLWNRTEIGINEPLMCLDIARGGLARTQESYPVGTLFVNPVEDVMLLCLQLLDGGAYRLRRLLGGKESFDPAIAPPSLRRLLGEFGQTWRPGQRRVYDPYTRHFFQDPLVSLAWWLEYATWVGGACRKLGR